MRSFPGCSVVCAVVVVPWTSADDDDDDVASLVVSSCTYTHTQSHTVAWLRHFRRKRCTRCERFTTRRRMVLLFFGESNSPIPICLWRDLYLCTRNATTTTATPFIYTCSPKYVFTNYALYNRSGADVLSGKLEHIIYRVNVQCWKKNYCSVQEIIRTPFLCEYAAVYDYAKLHFAITIERQECRGETLGQIFKYSASCWNVKDTNLWHH